MKYPDQSLESAKYFILVKISKKGSTFLKSLIPTSQIQMLVLLYVYSQLTAVFLWFIIPLIIFYICFLSLVVFSLQMFYGREALRQLRSVSELMKKYVVCLLIFVYGNRRVYSLKIWVGLCSMCAETLTLVKLKSLILPAELWTSEQLSLVD